MIECTLITTSGENVRVSIPKTIFDKLVTAIQTKGKEKIDFVTREEEIDGIYVGSKHKKVKQIVLTSIGRKVRFRTTFLSSHDNDWVQGAIIDEYKSWYLVELDWDKQTWIHKEQAEFIDDENEEN